MNPTAPGAIVRYRGREWIVLPSENAELALLRPIGGTDREVCGVHKGLATLLGGSLPYERIEPAQFPPPDPALAQDHDAVKLLLQSARLLLREGAAPFRALGRISFQPRPYQFVPLLMALRQSPVRLLIADDVWHDADGSLRAAIKKQWEENAAVTGGHTWELPDWIDSYPEIETVRNKGIPLPPFRWDEDRRAHIRAELDAYYAVLYGLTRKQLRYILDPADLTAKELEDILDPWEEITDPLDEEAYRARAAASDFPGETFRVLKEKETKQFGHYRTRRLVLEAWQRMKKEVR